MLARNAFRVAAVTHAGFQLVVTTRLYPALAAVPNENWQAEHDAHSRRIVPVVGVVYGGLLVTGVAALRGRRDPWLVSALCAEAIAVLTTALVAAPLHGRLGGGRADRDVRLLLRVDRWRTAAALVGAVAAVAAVAESRVPARQARR